MDSPLIMISPGHGGNDPGAIGPWEEKDWTLQASLYQYRRFRELRVPVGILRKEDTTIEPTERARRVKTSGAKYCIANHVNAGGSHGAEVWTSIYSNQIWGNLVLNSLVEEGIESRGVKSKESKRYPGYDYYFMHRQTGKVETLIIEYGFIDTSDAKKLKENWERYAESVVEATCKYINFDYQPPKKDPLNEAVNLLYEEGITNSPEYWKEHARPGAEVKGEYAGTLLQRVAKVIRNLKGE